MGNSYDEEPLEKYAFSILEANSCHLMEEN